MPTRLDALYDRIVCADHAETGPVPVCPWPECRQGTADSQVLLSFKHPQTGKPVELPCHRVELCSSTDYACFAWSEARPLGAGTLLQRVLWREIARRGWLPPNLRSSSPSSGADLPNVLVYHYTDAAGFLGIVSSGSLWMTRSDFLNDTAELQHGRLQLREAFRACATEYSTALADILNLYATRSTEGESRAYIAAFSTDGDSLSQWRSYGPIAIGFSQEQGAFGQMLETVSGPVIYDAAAQRHLSLLYAHLVASAYRQDAADLGSAAFQMYDVSSRLLTDVAVRMKHQAFADEREWRMAYISDDSPLDDDYAVAGIESLYRPKILFRRRGSMIVPYIASSSIAGNAATKLPIREIVVGPFADADRLARSIAAVLNAKGYGGIPVRRSTAPLRP